MTISKHAAIRGQQRGISRQHIAMLLEYGKPENKPGGATAYRLSRRILKEISGSKAAGVSQLLDKLRHQVIICGSDGVVLTCYHRN